MDFGTEKNSDFSPIDLMRK